MINNTIANDIKNHADNEGSGYRNWYCGIAADPRTKDCLMTTMCPKEKARRGG